MDRDWLGEDEAGVRLLNTEKLFIPANSFLRRVESGGGGVGGTTASYKKKRESSQGSGETV